jgi:group I intron endonuclease
MYKNKISGIYKWVNKINGKYYVGSSNHIKRRRGYHKNQLRRQVHGNQHLQSAWDKYGSHNFEFIIIEQNIARDQLLIIEQKYLDIAKLEPDKCYNISFIAGKPPIQTEEIRQKKSLASSGIKNPFYGKTHSLETRLLLSKQNMDKTIYEFSNIKTREYFLGYRKDFIKQFNLHDAHVGRLINRQFSQTHGWTFQYYNDSCNKSHMAESLYCINLPLLTGTSLTTGTSTAYTGQFVNIARARDLTLIYFPSGTAGGTTTASVQYESPFEGGAGIEFLRFSTIGNTYITTGITLPFQNIRMVVTGTLITGVFSSVFAQN